MWARRFVCRYGIRGKPLHSDDDGRDKDGGALAVV